MMLFVFAGLLAAAILGLRLLGRRSNTPPPLGLLDGRLRLCSQTSNCVCSESGHVPPLAIENGPAHAWAAARSALVDQGATLITAKDHYLHATFASRVFGFVDDVELRLDAVSHVIHLRSASRLGTYDFGVNRRRVQKLRNAYTATLRR